MRNLLPLAQNLATGEVARLVKDNLIRRARTKGIVHDTCRPADALAAGDTALFKVAQRWAVVNGQRRRAVGMFIKLELAALSYRHHSRSSEASPTTSFRCICR